LDSYNNLNTSHGKLKEYLRSGLDKEEFVERAKRALSGPDSTNKETAQQVVVEPYSESSSTRSSVPHNDALLTQTSSDGDHSPYHSQAETSRTVRKLFDERKRRIEAKREEEAATKREVREDAAEMKNVETNTEATSPEKQAGREYAAEQRKRVLEARHERARILRRIEDDKAERREKQLLKTQDRSTLSTKNKNFPTKASSENTQLVASDCAISVRLLDGSTIKSRFASSDLLGEHVRKWVDENNDVESVPYVFKHILTTFPPRRLEETDERKDLKTLKFCPSATLVMVEIRDYATAYDISSTTSQRARRLLLFVFSGVWAAVKILRQLLDTAFKTVMQRLQPTGDPSASSTSETTTELHLEPQNLYNGNSVRIYRIFAKQRR
jgi:hypothetical protein